jgi:hypothetical protein
LILFHLWRGGHLASAPGPSRHTINTHTAPASELHSAERGVSASSFR